MVVWKEIAFKRNEKVEVIAELISSSTDKKTQAGHNIFVK